MRVVSVRACPTCAWKPVRAGGECSTCWDYRHRTGRQRPEALIVAHGRRVADRLDEERARRRL